MHDLVYNLLYLTWFIVAGFVQALAECVFLALPASYGAHIALTQWPGIAGGVFVGLGLSAVLTLFQQNGHTCAWYAAVVGYIAGGILFEMCVFARSGKHARFVEAGALLARYPVLKEGARIGVLIGLSAAYSAVATTDDGGWDQWCRIHGSVPLYASSLVAVVVGFIAVAGNHFFHR